MQTAPTESIATIALGGNLNTPDHTMRLALDILDTLPGTRLMSVSRFFRTLPVDASGPDFCNAAARLITTLAPLELLQTLLSIELKLGRIRGLRNAPRTLDLDLITHSNLRIDTPELTLPHPRAHERAFVLVPLCEVAPDALLGPIQAKFLSPATDWLARLSHDPLALSQW